MKGSSAIAATPDQRGPVNVLFVVPSLGRGGAEAQVVDLINGLDTNRFRPIAACFENRFDRLGDLTANGIEFIHIPRQRKYDWTLPRRISKLVDERDINIIHCTLEISTLCGLIASGLSRQKPRVIGAVHSTIARNYRTRVLDRFLYRRALQFCDATVFVCNEQLKYWQNEYLFTSTNAYVVHNGIDVDRFRTDWNVQPDTQLDRQYLERLNIPKGAPVACCIAGFRTEKGHRILLGAFRQIVAAHGAHLLLAGDGTERKRVEADVARDPDLTDRVHFLGNVEDVRPVISASQFLVIPSTAVETFSIAMLESMAMARPVVATDVGGAREAVTSGVTGELIPANDIQSLAVAMDRMFANRLRCHDMGLNSRQLVLQRFDKRQMISGIERIFSSVLLT